MTTASRTIVVVSRAPQGGEDSVPPHPQMKSAAPIFSERHYQIIQKDKDAFSYPRLCIVTRLRKANAPAASPVPSSNSELGSGVGEGVDEPPVDSTTLSRLS